MTPAEASIRARIGGYTKAARYPRAELTAAARRAFADKWAREVDPEGALPEAERSRRAEAARRAYYAKLALKSARSRARRKSGRAAQAPPPSSGASTMHHHAADA